MSLSLRKPPYNHPLVQGQPGCAGTWPCREGGLVLRHVSPKTCTSATGQSSRLALLASQATCGGRRGQAELQTRQRAYPSTALKAAGAWPVLGTRVAGAPGLGCLEERHGVSFPQPPARAHTQGSCFLGEAVATLSPNHPPTRSQDVPTCCSEDCQWWGLSCEGWEGRVSAKPSTSEDRENHKL